MKHSLMKDMTKHLFDVVHTHSRISKVYIVTDQYPKAFERLKLAIAAVGRQIGRATTQ